MGKKGRPKPRPKQTGKKRLKRKRTIAGKLNGLKTSRKEIEDKYKENPSDYEPVRKDDSDEDLELEEQGDLEVLHQPQIDFKFLTAVHLQGEFKSNKKKRKATENIEEAYEKQPRLAGEAWKPGNHILLPLKDKSGVIQQNTKILEKGDSYSLSKEPDSNHETILSQPVVNGSLPDTNVTMATLSAVDLLKIRQEKIDAKKILITNLVSAILEDPNANIEKLNEMNKLCEEKDSDVSVTVRKLAIVSQLEIFKDIIPGYHIRSLSESEKSAKVSKDVKKIRKFEEGLLNSYRRYLEILERTIKEKKVYKRSRRFMQKGLPMIALNCLCDLLKTVPHFNYRTNIMTVLVPRMNDESANGEVSKLCCQTIHSIFKADFVGEISLEIVQLISKLVKSQSFNVQPCLLRNHKPIKFKPESFQETS